jgi:CRP-like cAMP-binding protein
LALKLDDVRDDEVEEFGPGEIIFTQGEDAECAYLVLEGEVALKVGGAVVATVGEGSLMGEMALLERQSRSALAEAVGDVRLLPLDTRRFQRLVRGHPEFARTVLTTLAHRLRQMNVAAGGTGGLEGPARAGDSTSRVLLAMKGQAGFPAGATIFKEGDRGDTLYFVTNGAVELRVGGKPVHTVEAGGFFGEMALLEDAPRSASAHAIEDCRLMPVDRRKFEYLLQATPDFALEMMRTIANRLRSMNRPA